MLTRKAFDLLPASLDADRDRAAQARALCRSLAAPRRRAGR
jgi:hypothetical protein